MAKQLNLLATGQVIPTALHTEMQQSYLEYAMSVIVGRALPDVRDGLKPVHRRIVYAMHELGLTPDRPYRKCARVVGDVLGKYHPHGDQAVYDALVRLVQDFSSRYPLLAGHGNFGSVDDDPPAAMRYTETRLASIAQESLLGNLSEAMVDFIGNFDNSQQEPTVLPAQLPILLLNGSSGIAVGMATNIPPHNLGEVVDGLIALIDRPNLSDQQLMELIPGPDFPTGGEIIDVTGIQEAYTMGRGSIPMRGVAQMEEVGRGRSRRPAIVVTELPFQVNKAAWIEKMAELVNQNKLEGIADIRDESDRDGMRVVIELKREANPNGVLHQLYRQTALQSNFGVILLALVDGQPRQLPLKQLLQEFLNFREDTLSRQYRHELTQAENRLQVLSGLLTALSNLDAVIEILRQSPDGSTAKVVLQGRFDLSDRQTDAILAMPLRRLTGLERNNLQSEFNDLSQRVQELQRLLGDRTELLKSLKKELRALKRKFGDERRTRIHVAAAQPTEPGKRDRKEAAELTAVAEPALDLPIMPEVETVLEISQRGYVRRVSLKSFQRQNRTQVPAAETIPAKPEELTSDPVLQTIRATSNQELLVLTRDGKAYTVTVGDIPMSQGRASKGTPLISLLPPAAQGDPDAIAAQFVIPEDCAELDLILLTQQGRIKRLPLIEYTNLTNRGLTTMKVQPEDTVQFARLAQAGDQVVIGTSGGRLLRFAIDDEQLPMMGRAAQGSLAIRLRKQEAIAGFEVVTPTTHLALISQEGYGKQLPASNLRLANRGEIGLQALQFKSKTDSLQSLGLATPEADMVLVTSMNRSAKLAIATLGIGGKESTGDRLLRLEKSEKVTTAIFNGQDAVSED